MVRYGEVFACTRCQLSFFVAPAEEAPTYDDYWRGDENLAVYSEPGVISELERKYTAHMKCLAAEGLPGVRLLDVGCGNGIFMQLARRLGFEPTGIDISPKAVECARQRYGLQAYAGALEESSFAPASFDVVTLWDVIEHVGDPRRLLQKACELLTDRGVLVLETPDERALLRRAVRTVHALSLGRVNYLPAIYYPDHRWYFSRTPLRALLREAGCREVAFHRDASIAEKAKGKRRAYGPQALRLGDLVPLLALVAMKRIPGLGNKMIAFARKGGA